MASFPTPNANWRATAAAFMKLIWRLPWELNLLLKLAARKLDY